MTFVRTKVSKKRQGVSLDPKTSKGEIDSYKINEALTLGSDVAILEEGCRLLLWKGLEFVEGCWLE